MLILGASGRVGRLLGAWWRGNPPPGGAIVLQARAPAPGCVVWRAGMDEAVLGRPDSVVVLWGVTSGDETALAMNTDLALEGVRLAGRLGASRVLVASSAAVYAPGDGLDEAAPLDPPTPYGRAKLAMERALLADTAGTQDIPPRICLLRLANVVGADSLFASLAAGRDIGLDRFASGCGPVRSYLAPGDLARVLETLSACPPQALPPVVNVCADAPLAMEDLARSAGARIAWRDAPASAVERVALDNARLRALTGPLSASGDAATCIAQARALGALP